jgi:methionine-rich copper-binding protein CopC
MIRKLTAIACILCLFIALPVVYAASASVKLTSSNTNVRIGNTTTINVVITASANIRGGQFNLSLNNSNFEVVSVNGANGLTVSSSGNLYIAYRMESGYSIPSGRSIATITVRPKSTATVGSKTIVTVSNTKVTLADSYETVNAGSSSITLTVAAPTIPVEQPVVSADNNLATLASNVVELDFDAQVTSYNVTVAHNVRSLGLTATAAHNKATVSIVGDNNFQVGENVIEIRVTAEDGTKKTYYVHVFRESSVNNNLQSLSISGFNISFDKNVLSYTINVTDASITNLDIQYETEDENATVEIVGNEDLIAGKNIIKIIVTSEDGERKTYTITVNKTDETIQVPVNTNNDMQIIWVIVSSLLLVIIVVQWYIMYRRKKEHY